MLFHPEEPIYFPSWVCFEMWKYPQDFCCCKPGLSQCQLSLFTKHCLSKTWNVKRDFWKVLRLSREIQVRNAAFRTLLKLCTLGIIWESEARVVRKISCRVVSVSYLAELQINYTGEKQNSKIDSCHLPYQLEYLEVKASFRLLNLEGHIMKLKCWQGHLFLPFIPSSLHSFFHSFLYI